MPDPNPGVSIEEIDAIKFLTFFSSWNEEGRDSRKRFLTLQFELPSGPFHLTIENDDTKYSISHLVDKIGRPIEVNAFLSGF
jgi:hypothetical protein